MTPQELADNVKFLRAKYYDGGETLKTINALVDLVAKMRTGWFAINNHEGIEISAAGDAAAKVWNDLCDKIDKADALLTALKEQGE